MTQPYAPHHRCTPHRCWPSKLGYGLAAFLACYACYLHAMSRLDRDTMEGRWRRVWEAQVNAAFESRMTEQADKYKNLERQVLVRLQALDAVLPGAEERYQATRSQGLLENIRLLREMVNAMGVQPEERRKWTKKRNLLFLPLIK